MFNFWKKKKEETTDFEIKKDNFQNKNENGIQSGENSSLSDDLENKENKNQSAPFSFLKNALAKTSDTLIKGVVGLVSSKDELDEFTLQDIEDALIKADLGIDLSLEIVENIKKNKVPPSALKSHLKAYFEEMLSYAGSSNLSYADNLLNIYFVVGVNGAGKTTFIGKLAHKLKQEGKKVLLCAGDTFRAAAEEQLDIWSKRANVDIVREDGAESAAVVYKSIEKAKNENYNVLIIDTAGRLQNKFNLIEELKKVKSVIDKKAPDANFESLLVLDANLGQNGLSQAKVFKEAVEITGAVLTKLDGSSKGGVIFSVAKEYQIPVKMVGLGEGIQDLKEFIPKDFIEAIF